MGVTANAAGEPTRVDADGLNSYFQAKFDDWADKNLCGAVQATISKNPAALGENLNSCRTEIDKCRFNARRNKIEELKDAISDREDDLDDMQQKAAPIQERLTNGCPDCGAAYYQNGVGSDQKIKVGERRTRWIDAGLAKPSDSNGGK